MRINKREIGNGQPPYIVAEIGASHNGSFDVVSKLVRAAAEAGADAVKFQCYTADTLTLNCAKSDFVIQGGPWAGRSLYELYASAYTPWKWLPQLFAIAKDCGITAFSSVFDRTSVDYLEILDCPVYKIASMEIVDTPLIEYVAKTGKPIIMSTGMASEAEVRDAIIAASPSEYIILNCVSGYPAKIEEMFPGNAYDNDGISDHTPGYAVAVAATVLGASVIEKHIKWYGDTKSEDAGFAIEPDAFAEMCTAVKAIHRAFQFKHLRRDSEESSRQLRRSLYVVKDVKRGDILNETNVRSIRPAYGLPPKDIYNVLGKTANCDLEKGTALSWDLIAS